jgi:hypothetical protein
VGERCRGEVRRTEEFLESYSEVLENPFFKPRATHHDADDSLQRRRNICLLRERCSSVFAVGERCRNIHIILLKRTSEGEGKRIQRR